MANRFWVGGAGTWNTSSTANWSASSGGASGASAPTAADDVFFDQAGTYTVTITNSRCNNITVSAGTVTFSMVTAGPQITGSLSFTAGTVASWGSLTTTFNATTTGKTINTGGTTLGGGVIFNGVGGGWTLANNLTIGNTSTLSFIAGTFSTSASNYSISCGSFSTTGTAVRNLSFNSSTVTYGVSVSGTIFTVGNDANLTLSAASATFQTNQSAGATFAGGGYSYGVVSFTNSAPTGAYIITGVNTLGELRLSTRNTAGITNIAFGNDQIITTLTLNSTSTSINRTFLRSDVIGTQRTLTVSTVTGGDDYDFRDIVLSGASISPTRAGNCGNNSGITFPAAKTVYYRQTGSNSWGVTSSWAPALTFTASCSGTSLTTSGSPAIAVGMTVLSSGGISLGTLVSGSANSWVVSIGGTYASQTMSVNSPGTANAANFPLAQDTAVFAAATYPSSGSTTTINAAYNIGTIDMSLRTTNTMTLATGATSPTIYGNWINGTGITISGTQTLTFAGRTTQQITSASRSFSQSILIDSPSGSVTLQDAFTGTSATLYLIRLNAGTFDANNFNVSGPTSINFGVLILGTLSKTLAIGSGTWTIGAGGTTSWNNTGSNLTVTGTGTISMTSTSAKTFVGGNISYSGITLNQGGSGALTISDSNTFANITNTVQPATITFEAGTTQTVSSFSVSGTAGNLVTINSSSVGTRATLSKASGTVSVSYCSIKDSSATGGATWNAFTSNGNTDAGNNLGWVFAGAVTYSGNFLMLF